MIKIMIIAVIVTCGSIVGWLFHRRSSQPMMHAFEMLADERNGTLKKATFLMLPKLFLSHNGKQVEVSSASTGIKGKSERYTYVLFSDFDSKGFEFRILPKSSQTFIDEKFGVRKTVSTVDTLLDQYLSVSANAHGTLIAVLTDEIKSDLLTWAQEKPRNKISDIRNYDDRLIFCVDGTLGDYSEYVRLIKSATDFHDCLENVLERKNR
jgi:hypothetical protein